MCEQCHPDRTGESWQRFLAQHRLKNICDEDGGWKVNSQSGHTYHVRSHMGVDRASGSYFFRTTCDCPARKRCRHIDAVLDMRYAEELAAAEGGDFDGMDILEREEM